MPHRVADPLAFERIDRQIENLKEAIKEAKVYRECRDQGGFPSFLRSLRLILENTTQIKNASMQSCTDVGERYALICLGKEMTIREIIESFEDSEKWEKHYQNEIISLEQEREELKKLGT